MAIVSLEGIRFNAFHGFHEEENILGGDYVIDVFMDVDIEAAAEEDDLNKTVNYETVFIICQSEMKKTCKLLETVATNIIERLEDHFEGIDGIKFKIRKLNPPFGGRVDCAAVEIMTGTFDKTDLIAGIEKYLEHI